MTRFMPNPMELAGFQHLTGFDLKLSVSLEEIEFELRGERPIPWADFWLNPRRLRGSDFLMRWSQGVWSEKRVIRAVNATQDYFALEYGPSSTAPDENIREHELYFELLETAGLGKMKRPDILVFLRSDKAEIDSIVEQLGSRDVFEIAEQGSEFSFFSQLKPVQKLPFIAEDMPQMRQLLSKAVLAVECENSLWIAKKMPSFGEPLRPMPRLDRKPGLPKNAVVPTIILKEEDRGPLRTWQELRGVKIHIWHVFFDIAFGLSLDEAERIINEGLIMGADQVFQAPGGATTKKTIYKIYYHYAYLLGEATDKPTLVAKHLVDKNGHILPYVHFTGGRFELSSDAIHELDKASQ